MGPSNREPLPNFAARHLDNADDRRYLTEAQPPVRFLACDWTLNAA